MRQDEPKFFRARIILLLAGVLAATWAGGGCGFPDYKFVSVDPSAGAANAGSSGAGRAGESAGGAEACEAEPCVACEPGFADCNAKPEDGCETSLETATDCGACGVACTNEHGTNACVLSTDDSAARCAPSCAAGFSDCDLRGENGCEVNLNSDVSNCGWCGHACPASGGTPVCVAGECGVSSCKNGFGDCDNVGACTYNLSNDPFNCGQCGYVCSSSHGTPRCNAGTCETECENGYGDCNAGDGVNDGCETKLNVPDESGSVPNCGSCGASCVRRAYTTINLEQCAMGVCYRDCFEGAHDCGENRNDPGCNGSGCGCEYDPCW